MIRYQLALLPALLLPAAIALLLTKRSLRQVVKICRAEEIKSVHRVEYNKISIVRFSRLHS